MIRLVPIDDEIVQKIMRQHTLDTITKQTKIKAMDELTEGGNLVEFMDEGAIIDLNTFVYGKTKWR